MGKYLVFVGAAFVGLLLAGQPAQCLVKYETGRLEVNGIVLLQDATDAQSYYYLPPAPRVSTRPDGGAEISVVKFVDPKGETSGGLLHLLITFDLPADEVTALEEGLRKANQKARLRGQVPLLQESEGAFAIISATLSDQGFTRSLISSGRAPVTPGAKAAVAASLSPHGATLLWESLNKPTSDVSVALRTYYEAVLPSFQAKIQADIGTVYTHYSKIKNVQQDFTRRQIRNITDELIRTGVIEVEIFDRLPEAAAHQAMHSLVDLCTSKLTEIIFDQQTGFTAIPEKEVAVASGQIKDRQQKGWLARLFTGTGNQKYTTDNQYVLKKREDIQRAVFSINLTRRGVIKVPVDTAGNISGLYEQYRDNPDMFRVVNLADPAFQKRDVFFCIDGDYSGAFEKIMNFAGVAVRKIYDGHADATSEVIFTREDIREGRLSKPWTYARLGQQDAGWLRYDYRTTWSVQGRHTISDPPEANAWIQSSEPMVTIAPPLNRLDLEIDADRFLFEDAGMRSAMLEIRYRIFGQEKKERLAVMRATDAESVVSTVIFHDPKGPVEYQVSWYPANGEPVRAEWLALSSSYLVLSPPQR